MIELKLVTKTHRSTKGETRALHQVSLRIQRGEIFGIIGRSGAGKSTLLRCINALEIPDSGSVQVAGHALETLSPADLRLVRQKISMVFQHFNLCHHKTVAENIVLPLRIQKAPKTLIENKIPELLKLVGLEDKRLAYPAQLSGGQKQRVAIARALATDPDVLLCDEATSALDPQSTQDILQLLQFIAKTREITIVMITHEMSVVKKICDRVAVMDHGEIVEVADVIDLFGHPQSVVAKALVHAHLHAELPEEIQQRLKTEPPGHPLVRLTFVGSTASQPHLSQIIQRYQLSVNMLQGNIDYIKNQPIGFMVVEFQDQIDKVQSCLNDLKAQHIDIEVLGYV